MAKKRQVFSSCPAGGEPAEIKKANQSRFAYVKIKFVNQKSFCSIAKFCKNFFKHLYLTKKYCILKDQAGQLRYD